jgi:hypothetical protein
MSRVIGDRLPEALLAWLDAGRAPAAEGTALIVCSVDADGRPHPAMLSAFEVVALAAGRLRLATYETSRTSRHLASTGVVTLIIVDEGMAYNVKGRATPSAAAPPDGHAFFDVHVDQVAIDAADDVREGETRIVSGIRYAASAVHQERARALLQALMWDEVSPANGERRTANSE